MKKNGKTERPTIYSLADIAGVSPGTVSRVLNNRDKVRPSTRARILQLAHEIGLKPQSAVRNRKIAVITEPHYTDRFHGYCSRLTSHVAYALSNENVGVLLPMDPVRQLPDSFIDGIVAITYDDTTAEALRKAEKKVPVVYLDHFGPEPIRHMVCSDHLGSGLTAAEYFIEHGRKHLAFLGGEEPPFAERLKGYRQAIREAGLPDTEKLYSPIRMGESLYGAVSRAVKRGADALYVPGVDVQSIEALHVLTFVMGLRVPGDIALIGGEHPGVSALLNPPLTTLSEPLADMAKAAVDIVLKLADGDAVESRHVMFPAELIARDSAG